ncbi:BRO1-like domain [Musa troglodytarum]|uniref:BRO1-like domain n=1 Tax=Musa troglodytarum TaxID=320322 RepID=A0A9E7FI74_9LILI|nr:BRO1-like domain [Musa troglodytarum]URD94686.1 BRO1-like domain [Musa troglodytarum]
MGCVASKPEDAVANKGRPGTVEEVAVFVPGLRTPKNVDFVQSLGDRLPKRLVEHLSALRTKIVVMAAQEAPTVAKPRRKTATQHGGSSLADLLQALEDYLPVLLGLAKDGSQLTDKVRFAWANRMDDAEETKMANAWFEVLSVLHLMAMICFSEANLLLLPKVSGDGHHLKEYEESRRTSIDKFLKAAGYLDCAIQHVLPRLPPDLRNDLPVDLAEGVLRSLHMQALGQATDYIAQYPLAEGWGGKHHLFIKLKYVEAKAAAYYYHGVLLDEGNTEKSHVAAIAALQAADDFLKESKRASQAFNVLPPTSRNPPPWGSMKYLCEKIPKHASSKVRINRDLYSQDRILDRAPTLPDFPVALKPDEYRLPEVDRSWNYSMWISV